MKIEIQNMAGHLIRRLNQISTSVFQEHLKAAGFDLTSVQFAAMNTLRAKPGIDQRTLAGLIAYDPATIGGVIDRLESKNMVLRTTNKRDRRAKILELTEYGNSILEETIPIVRTLQEHILTGLDETERQEFIRLGTKIAEAGNHLSRAPLVIKSET